MRTWENKTCGNKDVNALAQLLQAGLERAGIPQVELERRTGISDTTLARYLNGEVKRPSPSILAKLSGELNLSYEEVMAAANYPLKTNPETDADAQAAALLRAYPWAAQTVRDLAGLRPEGRAAVFVLIRALQGGEETEPQ